MRSSVGSDDAGDVAQVQRHAAEQALVIADVLRAQRVVGFTAQARQHGIVALLRIGGNVLVVLEIRRAGEDQCCRVGAGNRDLVAARFLAAAVDFQSEARFVPDRRILHGAGHRQAILDHRDFAGMRVPERRLEGETAGFRGRETHHDHLRGPACEHLAAKADAGMVVLDGSHCGIEVQFPAIAVSLNTRKVQQDVSERLVRLLAHRNAHELAHGEVFGFFLLAGEEQLADRPEVLVRAVMGVVVRLARPDGVFVELDMLVRDLAEDHGAKPAVAHRQGFGPLAGGLAVPQRRLRIGARGNEQQAQPELHAYSHQPSRLTCAPVSARLPY